MEVYTMDQWKADRDFRAQPGQEIEAEVYEEMYNCIPPKGLPAATARDAWSKYNIPVHAGFLMGEPHSSDKDGFLYHAFGNNYFGKRERYFYLGLSHPEKQLNGRYYYMDCMNALANDGLFPESEFKDDADAIRTAANYEATLIKYEYQDGKQISSAVLYEPMLQ